jgi:hypothetical protein
MLITNKSMFFTLIILYLIQQMSSAVMDNTTKSTIYEHENQDNNLYYFSVKISWSVLFRIIVNFGVLLTILKK